MSKAENAPIQIFAEGAEVLPMDFAMAYTALVPLVVEAFTFIECGNMDAGKAALLKARKVIEFGSSFSVAMKSSQNFDGTEPEFFR